MKKNGYNGNKNAAKPPTKVVYVRLPVSTIEVLDEHLKENGYFGLTDWLKQMANLKLKQITEEQNELNTNKK